MSKRIFVAGHNGMVGSALVRQLSQDPANELVTRTRAELDLTDQQGVAELFAGERIDEVYLGAAKVGGIHANNTYPAEFIYDNLMVECNVVHQAWPMGCASYCSWAARASTHGWRNSPWWKAS